MVNKILKCLRCEHEWKARAENPKVCPHCKSPYWNKERTRKGTFLAKWTSA